MQAFEVKKIPSPPLLLGEGTIWHPKRKALYFVDIDGKRIYGYREDKGLFFTLPTPKRVGFIVPWGDHLLAGVQDTLCHVDLENAALSPIAHFDFADNLRFNDGKCDADGRLWAGVMCYQREGLDCSQLGAFYGIAHGRIIHTAAPMDIPNGMAWADASTFYHTDTATGCIDIYDVNASGIPSNRRTAICIPPQMGSPDGFCIDTEGMLWVALWGGGCVRRFDPVRSIALDECIHLPQTDVSCCCFGGDDMSTLYITTAASGGRAGGLYACKTPYRGTLPNDYRAE